MKEIQETITHETHIIITKTESRLYVPGGPNIHGKNINRTHSTKIHGKTQFKATQNELIEVDKCVATFEFSISTDAQLDLILKSMLSELGVK